MNYKTVPIFDYNNKYYLAYKNGRLIEADQKQQIARILSLADMGYEIMWLDLDKGSSKYVGASLVKLSTNSWQLRLDQGWPGWRCLTAPLTVIAKWLETHPDELSLGRITGTNYTVSEENRKRYQQCQPFNDNLRKNKHGVRSNNKHDVRNNKRQYVFNPQLIIHKAAPEGRRRFGFLQGLKEGWKTGQQEAPRPANYRIPEFVPDAGRVTAYQAGRAIKPVKRWFGA